jgi:chromosome segregation ATPase
MVDRLCNLMKSKDELQTQLKTLYGINKNVSESLSRDDCATLIETLSEDPSVGKLIAAYADKNATLGKNNATYGRARSQAEQKLQTLQTEYDELEASIAALESTNQSLATRKQQLESDRQALSTEIQKITIEKQKLGTQVTRLNVLTNELTDANDQLKKDNKDLKNMIDAIRLKFTKEIKQLLSYEDSEIRKALVKLFKSTLG